MKRVLLFAGAIAAALVPGPVQAAPTDITGFVCSFATVGNPSAEDVQTGEVDGGPIVVADLDDTLAQPLTTTLTCAIHVGWQNVTHTGPDAVSASASGNAVVVLPPTVVSYQYDNDGFDLVSVCTEVTVTDAHGDTYHYYYDDIEQEFSSSPDVECQWPRPEPPEPFDWGPIDAIVCPIFAIVFPPDGDIVLPVVGGGWDCPPYNL